MVLLELANPELLTRSSLSFQSSSGFAFVNAFYSCDGVPSGTNVKVEKGITKIKLENFPYPKRCRARRIAQIPSNIISME
jgi:hypothetical protein